MDDANLSSVEAYKQRHQERISRRKSRRDAVLEERNFSLDVNKFETLNEDEVIYHKSIDNNVLNNFISTNNEDCRGQSSDSVFSMIPMNQETSEQQECKTLVRNIYNFYRPTSLDSFKENDEFDDEQNDESNMIENDESKKISSDGSNETSNDEFDENHDGETIEYLNLISSCSTIDVNLHEWTSTKTNEFCRRFLFLLRKANVSKRHCKKLLDLFRIVLPVPNNLPRSMENLLVQINGR